MSNQSGCLFVVATPIGNLADLSPRAVQILRQVDLIAAEDTRHSRVLLQHHAIDTKTIALHEHNEVEMLEKFVMSLQAGEDIALISDAGTPLVSDPGFRLVEQCHELGLRVSPVPGPSAVLAALSASGLPTDRFKFEGFLPRKSQARRDYLQKIAQESATLVFFEAPHRLAECLDDLVAVFGQTRQATLARELTKQFETVFRSDLVGLQQKVANDADQTRGEIVLVVAGAPPDCAQAEQRALEVLDVLLAELPLKQAVGLAAKIAGYSKNVLYKAALARSE